MYSIKFVDFLEKAKYPARERLPEGGRGRLSSASSGDTVPAGFSQGSNVPAWKFVAIGSESVVGRSGTVTSFTRPLRTRAHSTTIPLLLPHRTNGPSYKITYVSPVRVRRSVAHLTPSLSSTSSIAFHAFDPFLQASWICPSSCRHCIVDFLCATEN